MRLELEERLQRALARLGLIGRVGGNELRAVGNRAHGGGDEVVVDAPAEEGHGLLGGGVARGDGGELTLISGSASGGGRPGSPPNSNPAGIWSLKSCSMDSAPMRPSIWASCSGVVWINGLVNATPLHQPTAGTLRPARGSEAPPGRTSRSSPSSHREGRIGDNHRVRPRRAVDGDDFPKPALEVGRRLYRLEHAERAALLNHAPHLGQLEVAPVHGSAAPWRIRTPRPRRCCLPRRAHSWVLSSLSSTGVDITRSFCKMAFSPRPRDACARGFRTRCSVPGMANARPHSPWQCSFGGSETDAAGDRHRPHRPRAGETCIPAAARARAASSPCMPICAPGRPRPLRQQRVAPDEGGLFEVEELRQAPRPTASSRRSAHGHRAASPPRAAANRARPGRPV